MVNVSMIEDAWGVISTNLESGRNCGWLSAGRSDRHEGLIRIQSSRISDGHFSRTGPTRVFALDSRASEGRDPQSPVSDEYKNVSSLDDMGTHFSRSHACFSFQKYLHVLLLRGGWPE